MTVYVKPRARLDLLEQAEYYAESADIELAFRFQECAEVTFALLATQPTMGKPSRLRQESLTDVRESPVRKFAKHLIFYRRSSEGITVLRVLHGARDIAALLEEEPLL